MKHFLIALVLGPTLTILSYGLTQILGWEFAFSWLEFAAVATSYACTYLCVMQSRLNYPIGIVTTFLYSILFWQWQLPALALFNLYLVFSLAYGWWRWGPDGNPIPVTSLKLDVWLLGYVGLAAGIYALLWSINTYFGHEMTTLDAVIAVLSGVAQFLLDNKKIQTWMVWAVVNVLSIYLFWVVGLGLVFIQFILFLANTLFGWYMWQKSMKAKV